MTRETKIGLLVGMGVIILIGILISDHLSEAGRQQHAELDGPAPELDETMIPAPPGESARVEGDTNEPRRNQPLPPPDNAASQPAPAVAQRRSAEPEREVSPNSSEADEAAFKPAYQRVDVYDPPAAVRTEPREQAPPAVVRGDEPSSRNQQWPPPGFQRVNEAGQVSDAPAPAPARERTEQVAQIPQTQGEASDQLTHYVKEGETLSGIAREYYDDPNYWRTIVEANRKTLSNPDQLRPGMRLVIPDKAGLANRSDQSAEEASPSDEKVATEKYTVKSGESLSKLAGRYYDSVHEWRKLYKLNKGRIDDPNQLKEGDVILVPRD